VTEHYVSAKIELFLIGFDFGSPYYGSSSSKEEDPLQGKEIGRFCVKEKP
jgi:hypothetical protein